MSPSRCREGRRQRGQVLVLAAVIITGLILVVGLAIDVGLILQDRRDLVRVADAAALAGAGALSSGDPGEANDWVRQQRAVARVREYAMLNGFDPDAAGHTLDVEVTFTGGRKLVTVNASRMVPLVFMRLIGINEARVAAHGEGRQAEAPPLDIMLVQDLSASQCFDSYAPAPAGSDCELVSNPWRPDDDSYAYQLLYDATQPTVLSTASRWVDYTYPYSACDSSNSGCRPGCPVDASNLGGAWTRCAGNNASLSPINQPWTPFAIQQDAARYFVSKLDSRYDQVGLVGFSENGGSTTGDYGRDYNAHVWATLTSNTASVADAIGNSPQTEGQTGDKGLYPGGNTDMAGGINQGILELLSSRGREDAVAVMILLSDGAPTTPMYGDRNYTLCPDEGASGCRPYRQATMDQAQLASDDNILIYTVFVGTQAHATDYALMLQYIADLTDDHILQGTYNSGGRSLLNSGGPAYSDTYFRENVSPNYFVATNHAELVAAYDSILDMIYTRLVR